MRSLDQRKPTLEADHDALRRFLDQFRTLPIIYGQMVTVNITAGGISGTVKHSLNRAYKGGFIASESQGGFSEGAVVVDPNTTVTLGFDPKIEVAIICRRVLLNDKSFQVWLF